MTVLVCRVVGSLTLGTALAFVPKNGVNLEELNDEGEGISVFVCCNEYMKGFTFTDKSPASQRCKHSHNLSHDVMTCHMY